MTTRGAHNDIPCHHRRSLSPVTIDEAARRSEGSEAPHWFYSLAAACDSKGDMHPDDAVESVYRGSAAHISTFLFPSSIGLCYAGCCSLLHRRKGKVEGQISIRGELLFYAQRRRLNRVSAHGPFNICSVWHHLCAETSVRQRLCAQAPYQGIQFRTIFGTDSSLTLRMTTKGCSE